jgi:glycosyltransferase involved in cell wall biosynthesis
MTTISIAMCTYNGEAHLEEQLNSIAMQTCAPKELVIFDDRSTDGTKDIIKAFANVAPFEVRFSTNKERVGSTANFEQAILGCQGEIIALADHDDVWYPQKLARIDEVFVRGGPSLGAVFSDADLIDGDGQSLDARMWEYFGFGRGLQARVEHGEAFDVLLRKHVVPGCTMVFRRKFRDLVVPFPDFGVHDRWIAILIAAVAGMHAIPEPLIKYRRHQDQQVGVALTSVAVALRKGAVSEQLERARRPAANIYAGLADLYEAAVTRLDEADNYEISEQIRNKLRNKITHLKVRSALPQSLWYRIPVVLLELRRLHYHRYSNGLYSFARDILIGG